jgi:hypothetical protein
MKIFATMLILLMASFINALDTLVLASCTYSSDTSTIINIEDSLTSVFAPRLLNYGLILIDSAKIPSYETCYPTESRSVLRCQISSTSSSEMRIRFSVITGKDGAKYERDLIWDKAQSARQNLTLMTSKLIRLFEENLLARVQLQSDPSSANLLIDGTIKTVTPFETFLPLGRHKFFLTLKGYDNLETSEVVAPGNNRFSFLLKPTPVAVKPERVSIVIKEKETTSSLQWFIASGLLLTVGLIAEGFYVDTDYDYDNLVTNDRNAFNNLDREANRWLFIRNTTVITCSITTAYAFYKYFSK